MLKFIGGSFLKDIIGLIKANPDFLEKDTSARMSEIEVSMGSDYPKSLISYLDSTKSEVFISEIKNVLEVLQGHGSTQDDNQFLEAIAKFISEEFGYLLDELDHHYFSQSVEGKLEIIREKLSGSSHLQEILRCLLSENTYQELTHQAHHALTQLKDIPAALIQTPVELDSSLRHDIRKHFLKKYPYSFVEFQINPQIIGGMRVFVDGAVVDHSWLAKIQAITQLQF